MTPGRERGRPSSLRLGGLLDPGVWIVLGVALLTRLPQLDHPAIYDEYYTTLAVRTLLEEGSLVSGSFGYLRASGFTWMAAALARLWGESFVVARLVSLASGVLFPVLIYLTGCAVAGRIAGLAAALLLCLDPNAIHLSQLARPYALHALVFFVATVLLICVARPGPLWVRGLFLIVAGGLFQLALHLNYLTAIGLAALAVCALVDLGPTLWHSPAFRRLRPWALLGAFAAAILLLWRFGDAGERVLHLYRHAPSYLLADRSNFAYYVRYLGGHFPVLCVALPLAWLVALQGHRRFALFAAAFLVVAFALHSGAGRKLARYVLYLMPWFYLVLGVGAARAWKPLLELVRQGLVALSPRAVQPRSRSLLALPLAVAIGIAALFANPAYRSSLAMLFAERGDWPGLAYVHPPSDWEAAHGQIAELAQDACALVASSGIKALYHLRRLDFDLSVTVRSETYVDAEFAPDPRHKRPVISKPGSLQRVADAYASGLVVVDEVHWRRTGFVPDDLADFIESRFEPVPVPVEWRLLVFRWGDPRAGVPCPQRGEEMKSESLTRGGGSSSAL